MILEALTNIKIFLEQHSFFLAIIAGLCLAGLAYLFKVLTSKYALLKNKPFVYRLFYYVAWSIIIILSVDIMRWLFKYFMSYIR